MLQKVTADSSIACKLDQKVPSNISKRCLLRSVDNSKFKKKMTRNREYEKLKQMIPSINKSTSISKAEIVNEAVKYINELHDQLINKLTLIPGTRNNAVKSDLQLQNMQDIHRLFAAMNNIK